MNASQHFWFVDVHSLSEFYAALQELPETTIILGGLTPLPKHIGVTVAVNLTMHTAKIMIPGRRLHCRTIIILRVLVHHRTGSASCFAFIIEGRLIILVAHW